MRISIVPRLTSAAARRGRRLAGHRRDAARGRPGRLRDRRDHRGHRQARCASSATHAAVKPTIVLVHGAWADSSSWNAVVEELQARGYTVDAPPNPLRGVSADSDYLSDFLSTISGPIVLVGHSYGGFVITNAATGNPQVKALVYDDAFIPAAGDTPLTLSAAKPGSCLAVAIRARC